jgi:hypothetical protein
VCSACEFLTPCYCFPPHQTTKLPCLCPSSPTLLITRQAAAAQNVQADLCHAVAPLSLPSVDSASTNSSPAPTVMPVYSKNMVRAARIEQEGPNRIPILTKGNLNPLTVQNFENGCPDYFRSKEIEADKQTTKILPGFEDPCICMYINTDRTCILALPFEEFMKEFWGLFLSPDWEDNLHHKLAPSGTMLPIYRT